MLDKEVARFQGMETNCQTPGNRPSWIPEKINKSFAKKKNRDYRITSSFFNLYPRKLSLAAAGLI